MILPVVSAACSFSGSPLLLPTGWSAVRLSVTTWDDRPRKERWQQRRPSSCCFSRCFEKDGLCEGSDFSFWRTAPPPRFMAFLSEASWLPSVDCVSLRQSSRFLRAGGGAAVLLLVAFAVIAISAGPTAVHPISDTTLWHASSTLARSSPLVRRSSCVKKVALEEQHNNKTEQTEEQVGQSAGRRPACSSTSSTSR